MSTTTPIHEKVSRSYAAALERVQKKSGSCCGGGSTSLKNAELAGYREEAQAYEEAAGSSFGCGNPTALAGIEAGQTVLDLGSGAGFDLLLAADLVGPSGRVIGVDMTDEMIDAARANVEKSGHQNIELRKGLIEDLPVADGSVDWVISNCVINLAPEKGKVFAELARVLRPGGQLSVSDIVAEDLPEWLRSSAEAYNACIGGAISEDDYVAGLKSAGLEVEVSDRLVYDPAALAGLLDETNVCGCVAPELLEAGLEVVAGKVWSARFVGRKS